MTEPENTAPIDSPVSAPLIITGMHRSGTSLVAALLQSAGLDIGDRLLPADAANTRGYFENTDFLEFHRDLLRSQGLDENGLTESECAVDGDFARRAREIIAKNARPGPWGWKEPRTALFLPFWHGALPQARFVFLFRAPWLVVDSLFRRGTDRALYFQPTLAPLAWLRYNHEILKFYQEFPERCVMLDVRQVAQEPRRAVRTIGERFALPLGAPREEIFKKELLAGPDGAQMWKLLLLESFPETLACYNQLRAHAGMPPVQSGGATRPEFRDQVMQRWLELHTIDRRNVQGAHWLHEKNGPGPADTVLQLDEIRRQQQATADEIPALRQHLQEVQQRHAVTEQKLAEVTAKIEAELRAAPGARSARVSAKSRSNAPPALPSQNGHQGRPPQTP